MDTTTLTAPEVIDRVQTARAFAHQCEVEQIQLAVHWALLHPCTDHCPATMGGHPAFGETAPLAGPGTPLVDEFAPASLAAALGITVDAGRLLLADALELVYRLPRLWSVVVEGVVPVWRARQIARETHDLGLDAVAYADRLICAVPAKIRLVDATRLVNEARLYFDPDRAVADEEHELARRGDAELFDRTITRLAHELHELGDSDGVDVRRARAVGILADPQYALDLMSGHEAPAPTPGGTGAMNLYLHLTPQDLTAETGAVSIEKLGAATTKLLHDWLTRHAAAGGKVTLRPVIDLADPDGDVDNATAAIDAHDPPSAMRELCVLRDAHCVFPGCRRDSRGCDLDHIVAYLPMADGGPPGQTHPANLAPLCRTHHRMKTLTAWDYKRHDNGSYTWTTPTGHQYTVHPASRRPPERRT